MTQDTQCPSTVITEYSKWTEIHWANSRLAGIDAKLASELVMVMGLGGETAEIVEELLIVQESREPEVLLQTLIKELGDAMYYWARIVPTFGMDPAELFTRDEPVFVFDAQRQALKLVAASGHVLEAGKKYVRDGQLNRPKLETGLVDYAKAWRALCSALGLNYCDVLQTNRDKIEGRNARGTLRGNGNDR